MAVVLFSTIVSSFTTAPTGRLPFTKTTQTITTTTSKTVLQASKSSTNGRRTNQEKLMDDFKTISGEVIDPYTVLRVTREADKDAVKKEYYELSKLYHPDKARFGTVLPGKCNNIEEVEDEWERIKLSYEILSDKRLRAKYDRNSALADPSTTLGGGAIDLLGWGMKGVGLGMVQMGKGMFQVGGVAVTEITKKASDMKQEEREREMERKATTAESELTEANEKEEVPMNVMNEQTQEAREELRTSTEINSEPEVEHSL